MNNSINDVSFKAQMVTQLSGRHNIMSRVAKDFAKKTENIPGQLFIKRGARYENPGTIEISNGFSTYVMSKYDNLLGNNIKTSSEVTNDVVDKISDTFVHFFKALNIESKFEEKNKNIIKSIRSLKRVIKKYESYEKSANDNNNDQMADRFKTIANSYKSRLEKLEKNFAVKKNAFLREADKLNKKAPELKTWRQVVEDIEDYVQ